MAKDTLTLRPVLSIAEGLTVTADFQTIQSARRILNDERQKTILALRLQDVAENFLTNREIGDFVVSLTGQ